MSLKPKRVDFSSTWSNLRETIVGVITFSSVNRAVWNDRCSGQFTEEDDLPLYFSWQRAQKRNSLFPCRFRQKAGNY